MPFIGTTPAQGFVSSVNKQSFTANGSTTSFTLNHQVSNANDLEVFVGNVRQEPTAAYSASGTTLDFGSGNAPPNLSAKKSGPTKQRLLQWRHQNLLVHCLLLMVLH